MREVVRALAALAESPGPEQKRLGDVLGLPGSPDPAAYTDLFVFQLYPYASVYVGGEGMLGGEARDRVAGFWRALRRVPPAEPDHLAVLLALYAALGDGEQDESDPARALLWRQSRKALLWEHLASWLFPYLDKLAEVAPPFYRGWGALLREAVEAEIAEAGPAGALPLHLREAPSLADPRVGRPQEFLPSLLTPVRSGMLLVRSDLARAGRAMGVGLRMGERRFVLESLLDQDPEKTLAWLASEARAWSIRHLRYADASGEIAGFWAARARATAGLLEDLRSSAGESLRSTERRPA